MSKSLGQGSYGQVTQTFSATKKVKLFNPFIQECTVLGKLSKCRNIVTVRGCDVNEQTIVMDKYDSDLRKSIDSLSSSSREKVAREITYAMMEMHYLNMVHCDIKPNNIFLMLKRGEVTKAVLGDCGNSSTSKYCRPERGNWHYRGQITSKSSAQDVYSLGLVLLELFSGQRITTFGTKGSEYPDVERIASMGNYKHKTIIKRMVRVEPSERVKSSEVYHYFHGEPFVPSIKRKPKKRKDDSNLDLFLAMCPAKRVHRNGRVYSSLCCYLSSNEVSDTQSYVIASSIICHAIYAKRGTNNWRHNIPSSIKYRDRDVMYALNNLLNDYTFCSMLY